MFWRFATICYKLSINFKIKTLSLCSLVNCFTQKLKRKRVITRLTSHLWLNRNSHFLRMSECLRLIVHSLWQYNTAVTFRSSFVRPTFSAFSIFIYICNQLKCGGEKKKKMEKPRNASSRYFLLRILESIFHLLDLPCSCCIMLQLIHILPLKIVSHQKEFKKEDIL